MKQEQKSSLWFKQFKSNMDPLGKIWPYNILIAGFDLLFLAMLGIFLVGCSVLWFACLIGLGSAFIVSWALVTFSWGCFSFCFVIIYGTNWNRTHTLPTMFSNYLHFLYIVCMIFSFQNFASDFIKKPTDSMAPDLVAPYMCLVFLFLVEATALFLYAYDVVCGWECDPPSRWWIRTAPYAVMGLMFLLVYKLIQIHDRAGTSYSMFYSVAISVLAVNYLLQIMNERIVPKEGPFKKIHSDAVIGQ